ncbi:hypothetical protein [Mycobacterium sp. 1482292.6]|uniref:hypothetical protein n=1 Tax=Mycobacterium sp. 1482292.6 TaxID=1834081 RepID=UPI000ADC1ACF|nr:hypothetical protein [Mycobacterium sp. 1482292.6]
MVTPDRTPDDQDQVHFAKDSLGRATTAFRKLLVPQSIEASDNLGALFNQFDETTLNALIELCYSLNRALFDEPTTIVDQNGAARRRYMFEFIDDGRIVELGNFIESIFSSDRQSFPGRQTVIEFFREWLRGAEVSVKVSVASGTDVFSQNSSEKVARNLWANKLEDLSHQFDINLFAGSAAQDAEKSAQRAAAAEAAAERAAGRTGALSIGNHFRDISKQEGWKALAWTAAAFGGIAATLWISYSIVHNSIYSKWVEAFLHLIVVLPIIGAATYAASLARHHRVIARWAKTAAVQVDSVEAFSKQLASQQKRDEVILNLGRDVFSTPNYRDDIKGESLSAIPPDLLEALKDALKEVAKKLPPRGD